MDPNDCPDFEAFLQERAASDHVVTNRRPLIPIAAFEAMSEAEREAAHAETPAPRLDEISPEFAARILESFVRVRERIASEDP